MRPLAMCALVGTALVAAGCGSGSSTTVTRTVTRPRTVVVTSMGPVPRCKASAVAVGIVTPAGNGAAGSFYEFLTFRNTGSTACTLAGFPGVSAFGGGRQLGSPAQRSPGTPRTVALAPGVTTRAQLQINDVGVFSPSKCQPAQAAGLRVFPPNDFSPNDVKLSFRACSKKGTVYMSVSPVS
jgi:Domain of unknown function (DUF4232)